MARPIYCINCNNCIFGDPMLCNVRYVSTALMPVRMHCSDILANGDNDCRKFIPIKKEKHGWLHMLIEGLFGWI